MGQRSVVLLGESALRIAGEPVHVRNRRAAERAGARIAGSLAEAEGLVLLVPGTVAIEPGLVAQLAPVHDPVAIGGRLVWGPAEQVRSLGTLDPAPLPRLEPPPGTLLDAATSAAARAATRILLLRTGKASDGPVSRLLNRPMSRAFSRLFLALGLSPIHASAVSLAIGLAAAWFAAQPGWLPLALCGLLFQAASMFDGVDGEMARVSLRDSVAGARIDTFIDNATYLACLAGFVIGWAREGAGAADLAVAAAALIAVPLVLFQVLQFTRRHSEDRSLVFFTTCVHRAAGLFPAPGLKAASALFPALRRDVLALLLMLLAFTGSRATILGAVVAGCAVAAYVLIAHRARLAAAATA